jgi:hypothetical protein
VRHALAVFLVVGLAACGSGKPSAEEGTLHLRHTVDTTGSVYIEGTIWHVWITGEPAPGVRIKPFDARTGSGDLRVALRRGSYVIHSEEFPCSGNCDNLDPARERCQHPVRVEAGQTVEAEVVMRAGKGCTITLS